MKAAPVLILMTLLGVFTVNAQNKTSVPGKSNVEIYYFHPTERCPIDQSIEENLRKVMHTSFSKEMKDGILKFQVFNTDDKANAKIVSRFDINTQALYIVKMDKGKEIKTDLTEFAFSFGQSNPAKFKQRLKDEVVKALK